MVKGPDALPVREGAAISGELSPRGGVLLSAHLPGELVEVPNPRFLGEGA